MRPPSEFRRVQCPCCGLNRGYTKKVNVPRRNAWNFPRDPKPFGEILSSQGRGTLKVIGTFGPSDDPDGFFPLVKFNLLAAIAEYKEKGYFTPGELAELAA
ncbi:MAG: hypothetical protein IH888_04225 [Planctomycetes bacterium]|nr:hypothetical protein [Planctomycetota bacterium]